MDLQHGRQDFEKESGVRRQDSGDRSPARLSSNGKKEDEIMSHIGIEGLPLFCTS
jgi:hypothetical protein